MKVRKAFIPVAGYGTRFLPATKAFPKEMLPVVDTPALQYIVEEAVQSGIEEIMLLISPAKKGIIDHFSKSFELEEQLVRAGKYDELRMVQKISKMVSISYAVQEDMKGTGKAVMYAKDWVGEEPFAVLFGDDIIVNEGGLPVTKQLIDAHESTGTSIVGVQEMPEEVARRCGVMVVGKSKGKFHELKDLMEKPAPEVKLPTKLTSLGRFVLTPEIFGYIEKAPAAKNGEYYLTDALALQAKAEGNYAYEFDGVRYDLGNKLGFLIANIEFGLKNKETAAGLKEYLKSLKIN